MPDSGGRTPPEDGDSRGEEKVLFGKYAIGKLLGIGAFAKVYHARNTRSGHSVAIKCISKQKVLKSNLISNVKREISIMRRLRHPHIVRLLEVLASRSKIYFVMEFAKGGELFSRIARGRLPEDLSRKFFQQLISAVGFCHSRGVFHRDLKPENLLLDENGDLKVSDFGLSAVAEQIRHDGLFHTLCGTPAYVAPEILSKKGYDGAKVDVWSCGVVLFVLNAGYLPFNHPNLMEMYRKIYRGDYRCPRWTSPELRRLISRILDTNPETRITVDGIVHDPWFKKGLKEEKWTAMMRFHEELDDDKEVEEERDLNAFDIISFATGFDLSGLFDAVTDREWFVSSEPVDRVLERVEEVGRGEGLSVRRRNGKMGLGGMVLEGQNGNLVVRVEIYRLTGGLLVIEVEMGGEDNWSSGEFCKEKLGPALKALAYDPRASVSGPAGDREEELVSQAVQSENIQISSPNISIPASEPNAGMC